MKKAISLILALGLLVTLALPAQANVYYFEPNPTDLSDLDHYHYYSWGIEHDFAGAEITEVTMTFHNIQDWIVEPDDILYINLLDTPPAAGVHSYYDYREVGNAWEGDGPLVTSWTDPLGYPNPAVDLTFTFSEFGMIDAFNDAVADGFWGFGFDSDCHYYNDGVELRVETAVPEPVTFGLVGLGLAGIGFLKRRKH